MAVNAQAYFSANPDVAASYASNNYGMTADEFANYHFANYGAAESRTPPSGVTNAQILDFLKANPGLSDAQIVSSMKAYGISPSQMASAVGLSEGEVASRVAATVPYGQAVLLGDTWVQPNYQTIGSGMDQQVGGIENISVYKSSGDVNSQIPEGTTIQNYNPTGELVGTSVSGPSSGPSFFGGLVDALKDPVVLAALAGGYGAGLFGGAGAAGAVGADLVGLSGIPAGSGALTAAETAALYGTGASTLGTAGVIGSDLAGLSGIPAGTGALTAAESAALYGTGGLTTGALTAGGVGGTVVGTGAGASSTLSGLTGGSSLSGLTGGSSLSGLTTAGGLTGANTLLGGATLGSTLSGLGSGVGGSLLGSTVGSTLGSTVGSTLGSTLANTAASTLGSGLATGLSNIGTGLTNAALGQLLSTGLTTGAGLLQQQTSKEAADKARAMIEAETASAKAAAQFRPIGMTTRFGSSKFGFDPTTGQLTSAGYTLSPEAKAAQDRFVKLAESGLVQAEGAQEQFKPLQTGATSLFTLGNKYLAQTPETVASDYMKSQLALLAPGREQELAFLQNKLQQQGRGGLSVAQGGTLGATTPELQAFMNAKIQEDARLAANAQQYGQQNVLFGAGLLGQGSQAMGQYYGGQQAAYAPYTTALGQVQGLETAAQQPFSMSAALAQQAAQAGSNVGQLGLGGAKLSTALATSPAATTNPYSTALGGIAASPVFGQVVGGLLGGTPATSGFSYGQYGTGIDPSTGEYFGSLYF